MIYAYIIAAAFMLFCMYASFVFYARRQPVAALATVLIAFVLAIAIIIKIVGLLQ
jgi:hypothetical protein